MKPDKNPPPERHELPELLDKLKYELWMLGECAKKLAVDDLEEAEHNAWLEAYIIHARLLTEFFRDKPRKDKDDVVAKHYLGDYWKDADATTALEALWERTEAWNKWLAHLTATRVREDKPNQDIADIHKHIGVLTSRFDKLLPGEYRDR